MADDPKQQKETEWRSKLTPEQYDVLREQGTEMPFQNAYWNNHDDGMYHCAGCGTALFSSEDKYDSGTGWPSYSRVAESGNVELIEDDSADMRRTEVRCKNCGGHLGHVFPDGPGPTCERYCINSAALKFQGKKE